MFVVDSKAVTVKDSERGSKDANMFTYYIEAVSIHNQDRGNKAEAEIEPLSETTSSSNGLLTFNMKDYHAIRVSLYILQKYGSLYIGIFFLVPDGHLFGFDSRKFMKNRTFLPF